MDGWNTEKVIDEIVFQLLLVCEVTTIDCSEIKRGMVRFGSNKRSRETGFWKVDKLCQILQFLIIVVVIDVDNMMSMM